mmetsp:Transcript_105741/g.193921  ORF Transcript_105741/g.193921 Transcript_105741/m.193921 type:complete len:573 (+) Transcript_105741:18-1736(+)
MSVNTGAHDRPGGSQDSGPAAKRPRAAPPRVGDLKAVLSFHFSGPKRLEGRLKWFDKEKGFGKINPAMPRGQMKAPDEIFVHRNQIEGGPDGSHYAALAPGALVTYQLGKQSDGKQCAENVRCEGLALITHNGLMDAVDAKISANEARVRSLLLGGLQVGTHQEIGRGKTLMEDRFVKGSGREVGLLGASRKAASCVFFGVFDGHGGASCSDFVALQLERSIYECLREQKKKDANSEMTVRSALLAGFRVTQHNFLQYANKLDAGPSRAWATSGSTACTVTLYGPDEDGQMRALVANAGDSRAVLGKRDGLATRLSNDHAANVPSEKKRVEQAGGTVAQFGDTWRVILKAGRGEVTRALSVTRSFGDVDFKSPVEVVSSVPEVTSYKIDPDNDMLLILASDGVFSTISDAEAVRLASGALAGSAEDAAERAARLLVEEAHTRNAADDKTALVVWFGGTPVMKESAAPAAASVTASSADSAAAVASVKPAKASDDMFEDGADPVELSLLDDIFSGYAREMGVSEDTSDSQKASQSRAPDREEEGKNEMQAEEFDKQAQLKKKALSSKVAKKVF